MQDQAGSDIRVYKRNHTFLDLKSQGIPDYNWKINSWLGNTFIYVINSLRHLSLRLCVGRARVKCMKIFEVSHFKSVLKAERSKSLARIHPRLGPLGLDQERSTLHPPPGPLRGLFCNLRFPELPRKQRPPLPGLSSKSSSQKPGSCPVLCSHGNLSLLPAAGITPSPPQPPAGRACLIHPGPRCPAGGLGRRER